MSEYLTIHEVTEALQVSRITVYRYLRSGRLPFYRAGSKLIRIKADDLRKFIEGPPSENKSHEGVNHGTRNRLHR